LNHFVRSWLREKEIWRASGSDSNGLHGTGTVQYRKKIHYLLRGSGSRSAANEAVPCGSAKPLLPQQISVPESRLLTLTEVKIKYFLAVHKEQIIQTSYE
jgi:hypothetical protein